MSCLALAPALLAAFLAAAATVYVLQLKSLAQSLCVRHASRLGEDLARHLTELTRLNPRARRLRAQRLVAERVRRVALATLNPLAIEVAEARLAAVVAQQLALAVRQRTLLAEAELARFRHRREFRARVAALGPKRVSTTSGSVRALAVRANPPSDPAPDYVPEPRFAARQRQDFTLDLALAPAFARAITGPSVQRTSCAITLERKERTWKSRIVAASASSNSRW